MCGICGWIGFDARGGARPSTVEQMNATLAHRGPDDSGTAMFENAALGMTRLSIIDVAGGHQPIANHEQTCWIVYNGEIYNFRELRAELEAFGYRFRTRTDTEVVLHAYEQWGDDCVRHLRGMFAFAIYDLGKHGGDNGREAPKPRLFLARDRLGKKPLYYSENNGAVIFASEIKALLAHPLVASRVNHRVIPLYLAYGYVPAPLTMFDGIYELPPAHTMTVVDGKISSRKYWDLPPPDDRTRSEKYYVSRLQELLEQAIRIRLISDVPLGAFLSGGLDSTAIVAGMARLMREPVATFAMGFADDPSFNELRYARVAAEAFKTDHHEFVVRPDAIQLLPKLVWHYDQPFADSSAIPSYLVAQYTREHRSVVLTGDGGDELFAGYERFAAARLAETYQRVPQYLQVAATRLFCALPESTSYNGFVRRARRFMDSAPLPLRERYFEWVAIFHERLIRELLAEKFDIDPVSHFKAYFAGCLETDAIAQLLSVNLKTYLAGDLLVKTDRMTMAHSLEARCPLLDQELVEFSFKIPSQLKLNGVTTKYILKRAMQGLLPNKIVYRKKHGFGVPIGHWFRTSLKDYVRQTLLSRRTLSRGYFKEEALQRLVQEHESGKRDYGHKLWALLTFEMWHRVFIDADVRA